LKLSRGDRPVITILALVALSGAWGLWPELSISRVDLNDNVSHFPVIARIVQTIERKLSENSRQAKFYRLTGAGLKQLLAEEERWQRLTRGVSKVLRFA
jgi:hypothetical protein